ncbi:MAG: type II toxin-antitoxin system RelE/ParE family toxin [bacterium]
MLKRNGTRSGMPDFRYIKGSNFPIWEIRIKHPKGYFRIFIYRKNNTYYVLNHFWKKQAKTPKGEILKAEKLIEDIERRVGG